jgi:hypothetical protein
VTLAFAELTGPVTDRLKRYGLYDAIGPDRFFPTIGTAVGGYLQATGVRWVDWEEQRPTSPTLRSDHPMESWALDTKRVTSAVGLPARTRAAAAAVSLDGCHRPLCNQTAGSVCRTGVMVPCRGCRPALEGRLRRHPHLGQAVRGRPGCGSGM